MTIEAMKEIAKENNGIIPVGMAMTMTDFEIKKAIKHGYLKEEPEKVRSPEPKKETGKGNQKTPEETSTKTLVEEKKDSENAVVNLSASPFSKKDKDVYKCLDKVIYDCMQSMQKSSFDIAFSVYGIYINGYFKIDGYKNIYDYARERYGIARGTTNNFINIVDRFCVCDENVKEPVYHLKSEFSGFSSTQLICMLGHTNKELTEKKIVPEMSTRDIKKALKDNGGNNGAKGETVNTLNGGKPVSKSPDAENGNTGDTDRLKELRANLVLELDGQDLKDFPKSIEEYENYIGGILTEKVKVICKLLKSGHCIQILDILP